MDTKKFNQLMSIATSKGFKTATNKSGLTIELVLEALCSSSSIVLYLRERTGCSKQTITRFLAKTFPTRNPEKDKYIDKWLLRLEGLKQCPSCGDTLSSSDFYDNKSDASGKQTYCKECSKKYRIDSYNKNPTKEIIANEARKRNLHKPSWQKDRELELFYASCPVGYHVDHIIPINNDLVCGLHCINNLQYLTKEQNLSKSNKFTILDTP